MKVYSKLDSIPRGNVSDRLINGCMVLEGGAWRGLYSQGALDALMQEDINLSTTIGVSAGAMSAINYVSGQIGRGPRFNLTYRHDSNYCGFGAMKRDHGVTGFHYLFEQMEEMEPMNHERFDDPNRRFVVTATDCLTGRQVYFEKGSCDIQTAVRASATVPYVSLPVMIEGRPYLDGGIACKIPVDWAVDQGFDKIVIIRTRDVSYRKAAKKPVELNRVEYGRKYPAIMRQLMEETPAYNLLLDRIETLEKQGKVFVIAPSVPVGIHRFEGNMEKLGALYEQGYEDARSRMIALKKYLNID